MEHLLQLPQGPIRTGTGRNFKLKTGQNLASKINFQTSKSIERERRWESLSKNRPVSLQFPVSCDGSRGGDGSSRDKEEVSVRMGPFSSDGVVGSGGGVVVSVR
ncbi:unnamed protein product [Prunus armeniaca]